MSREKKAQIIEDLEKAFARSNIGIFTDYRGLPTTELTALRRQLRESGTEYRVVKNTLARSAAEKAGMGQLASLFEGPLAIAFAQGDATKVAKVLTEYIRNSKSIMVIRGGFMEDRVLTPENIATLSTLPSKEILIAKVLGGMQSPIVGLVSVLAAPIRGIMGVLQARMKQLEEG